MNLTPTDTPDEPPQIRFMIDGKEILRLDAEGMHYAGECIKDAGVAYEAWTQMMAAMRAASADKREEVAP